MYVLHAMHAFTCTHVDYSNAFFIVPLPQNLYNIQYKQNAFKPALDFHFNSTSAIKSDVLFWLLIKNSPTLYRLRSI